MWAERREVPAEFGGNWGCRAREGEAGTPLCVLGDVPSDWCGTARMGCGNLCLDAAEVSWNIWHAQEEEDRLFWGLMCALPVKDRILCFYPHCALTGGTGWLSCARCLCLAALQHRAGKAFAASNLCSWMFSWHGGRVKENVLGSGWIPELLPLASQCRAVGKLL